MTLAWSWNSFSKTDNSFSQILTLSSSCLNVMSCGTDVGTAAGAVAAETCVVVVTGAEIREDTAVVVTAVEEVVAEGSDDDDDDDGVSPRVKEGADEVAAVEVVEGNDAPKPKPPVEGVIVVTAVTVVDAVVAGEGRVNPIVVDTGVGAVSVREGADVTEGAATEEVIGNNEEAVEVAKEKDGGAEVAGVRPKLKPVDVTGADVVATGARVGEVNEKAGADVVTAAALPVFSPKLNPEEVVAGGTLGNKPDPPETAVEAGAAELDANPKENGDAAAAVDVVVFNPNIDEDG